MEIPSFLSHLTQDTEPLILLRNGQPPAWSDVALHQDAAATDAVMSALLGLTESAQVDQRGRLLYEALRRSRTDLTPEDRALLDRTAQTLLRLLDADRVITVFLALRRVRANHQHVRRTIASYLLEHPAAESLWQSRRPAVADCLEHALGKNVLRACARYAGAGADATEQESAYLRRQALRFAREPGRAIRLLAGLDRSCRQTAPGVPDRAYQSAHQAFAQQMVDRPERPNTITATDRGAISAALIALYRETPQPGLRSLFRDGLERIVTQTPRFPGHVALVLDMSASLRGYGDREFCYLAQSVAFRVVLERTVQRLTVHAVGGSALGSGATDLATTVLDALEPQGDGKAPDVVLVVSDGYENRYAGDLARVTAALPQAGIRTPVVFCQSKFTAQDDLALRTPAPDMPATGFWHEADFPETLLHLYAGLGPGPACLHAYLTERLERAERLMRAESMQGDTE